MLLRGSVAVDAKGALGALSRAFLARKPSPKEDGSFSSGTAGLAIVHAVLEEALPGRGHARAAEQALDCAIEVLATRNLPPSLYSGFVGIAWAVERIRGDASVADEDDPLAPIDEALVTFLDRSPWTQPYDLIEGLVGVGTYALERVPRASAVKVLGLVIAKLAETAKRREPGLAWRSSPEWLPRRLRPDPFPPWNLGVAHGVPGVVAFLAGACGARAPAGVRRRAGALLDGAVAWVLSQELPSGSEGCFAWAAGRGIPRRPARLAWCYGDPGVAVALLLAARARKKRAWERAALRVALRASERAPESAAVVDTALCHGAAGVAHVFHRLFLATRERRMADAARAWFDRALAMRRARGGFAGFRNLVSAGGTRSGWRADSTFLVGAGGIALALAAATTKADPWWDRPLLLSHR